MLVSQSYSFYFRWFNYKIQRLISFDGGLVNYPYVNFSKPVLHINPSMWKNEKRYLLDTCMENDTLDLMNCYIGLKTSNLKM